MKKQIEFTTGQRIYLRDGTAAIFKTKIGEDFFVTKIFQVGEVDEEEEDDHVSRVGQIFLDPPVGKRAQEIVDLDNQIANLRSTIGELDGRIRERQKELVEVKKWGGFGHLQAFLEGRITHLVKKTYSGVIILTFKDAIEAVNDYGRSEGQKLLSLFGRSKGHVDYKINDYYDGSGSWHQVYPAYSYEDAVSIAKREFDEAMEEYRKENLKGSRMNGLNYWIKSIEVGNLGFEIPSDLMNIWNANEAIGCRQRILDLEKTIDAVKIDLAKHESNLTD